MAFTVRLLVNKVWGWTTRYFPAEIAGTVTALAAALVVRSATHSAVATAAAGSLAETLGFYGFVVAHELLQYYRSRQGQAPLRRALFATWHTMRGLLVEFGPAEALDGLLVRPFLFYWFPRWIHNFLGGMLIGKLLADGAFLVLAAIGFEIRKRASMTPESVDPGVQKSKRRG